MDRFCHFIIALVIGSHSIAFLMTFFRLAHRFNTRRLWWDDFWAFVAILSDIFVWIIFMLTTSIFPIITPSGKHLERLLCHKINEPPLGARMKPISLSTRSFLRLGTLIFYTTTLWYDLTQSYITEVYIANCYRQTIYRAARMSVAVTIVRLLNPGHFRAVARMAALILGAFWLSLVVQKIFICGGDWHNVPACPIPRVTGYLELGSESHKIFQ